MLTKLSQSCSQLGFEFRQFGNQRLHISMLVDFLPRQTFCLQFLFESTDVIPHTLDLCFNIPTTCRFWGLGSCLTRRSRRLGVTSSICLQCRQLFHENFDFGVFIYLLSAEAFSLQFLLQCSNLIANSLNLRI